MKRKLMALVLAAGLAAAGTAVQAAEADTKASNGCSHPEFIRFTDLKTIVNWDGTRHYLEYEVRHICIECEQLVYSGYEGNYEPHDYEQIYFDNGKVMSYCTVCDDYFFW